MESTNHYNTRLQKLCKNGCGKNIEWNTDLETYVETDTGQKHYCPNWKPLQQQKPDNPATHILTKDQFSYMDSIGPALSETLNLSQRNNELLLKLSELVEKMIKER